LDDSPRKGLADTRQHRQFRPCGLIHIDFELDNLGLATVNLDRSAVLQVATHVDKTDERERNSQNGSNRHLIRTTQQWSESASTRNRVVITDGHDTEISWVAALSGRVSRVRRMPACRSDVIMDAPGISGQAQPKSKSGNAEPARV
jgi:hypothetical protein